MTRYNKHCLFLTPYFYCLFLNSSPLTIDKQADCFVFSKLIKTDSVTSIKNPSKALQNNYTVIKRFSGGKGGAYVALVSDNNSKDNKVLKIFPSIDVKSNKYNYREPFYTCLNGFITFADLGIKIIPGSAEKNAFPRLYEVGITNKSELDTSGKSENFVYPYMVFEFVKGASLSSLGGDAARNEIPTNTTNYRLYKNGTKDASLVVKQQSDSVVYQIVHLLYQMKRITINGEQYGFYHADLNSGNIMVKDRLVSGSWNAGYGPVAFSNVPLVTFIDFGHSTSNFDDELGSEVKSIQTDYHKDFHIFSGSTQQFYKDLNGKALSKISAFFSGIQSTNSDMRLYGVIAKAFFDSGNFLNEPLMRHLQNCKTSTECVTKVPALIK